jgi:hypothetical protein
VLLKREAELSIVSTRRKDNEACSSLTCSDACPMMHGSLPSLMAAVAIVSFVSGEAILSATPAWSGTNRPANAAGQNPEGWQKNGPAERRAKVRSSVNDELESLPVPAPMPTPPRSMAIPVVPVVPVVVRPPPASKRTTNPPRLLDLTDLVS